jgi:hypothetical protein|tara:strand:+ start:237 stop:536 length:300 start_codon:yes stop_codon:yes gene_type:complete
MLTASGVVSVDGVILFPEEWQGNIDQETIVIQLTPIGTAQELFVDRIEWGAKAIIRNGGGGALKAYYTVTVQELAPAPVVTKEKPATMSKSKSRTKTAV